MARNELLPRFIELRLVEALEDSPVVLIQGPRQCGKTTLAQMVCAPELLPGRGGSVVTASRGYSYLSFDDDSVRAGAETDPMGFISDLPERVVLDGVQRVPGLFTGLKLEIDRRRVPGGSYSLAQRTCWPYRLCRTLWPSLGDGPATSPGPVRASCEPPRR